MGFLMGFLIVVLIMCLIVVVLIVVLMGVIHTFYNQIIQIFLQHMDCKGLILE